MLTLRPVPARHRPTPTAARRAVLGVGRAVAALALCLLPAAPAAAHDQLVSSDPPADAVVATPPAAVTLTFSAELIDISATVLLEGPTGPVEVGTPAVAGTRVTAALPAELPGGAYVVTWRVVSADGHPVQGTFGFTVDAPVVAPTTTPTPTPAAEPEPTPSGTTGSTGTGGRSFLSPLSTVGLAGLLALLTAVVVITERRVRRTATTPGDDS